MNKLTQQHSRRRGGFASVMALILLAIFATLAAAMIQSVGASATQAGNQAKMASARLQAESGLSVVLRAVSKVNLARNLAGDALLADLKTKLAAGNALGGAAVTHAGGVLTIARASTGDQQGYLATIQMTDADTAHISVTGDYYGVQRTVGISASVATGKTTFFGYGVASRSAIRMTGNARVVGANTPAEGQMLSATYTTPQAIDLTGNVNISGDLFVSNPAATVGMTGNVTIGGVSYRDAGIADHVHIGVGDVEFPEVDPTVFEPFATNIVDKKTNTSGNKTFRNIRIKAGANPNFSGNINLLGVIYIEAPNQVHFSGNTNLTGIIVTQDAGENVYDSNTIRFTGNMNAKDVSQLPNEPDFAQLRQMPGSFLLAPGFGVQFSGNFGTIGGTIAADAFQWTGNAGGRVKGMVINYSNSEFNMTGNSELIIDRTGGSTIPPGFAVPSTLAPEPGTYREY